MAPTVTAGVNVASDAVTFTAQASDNVGVTEVVFLMDGGALEGTVSTNPGEGVFSLPISINFIADGTHSVVARARDAAGNTQASSPVSFVVQRGSGNPAEPLTVTASVDGNFGLIRLSAVSNVVNSNRLEFLVDGTLVGTFAGADGDALFLVFDARALANGRHSLVARAIHPGPDGFDEAINSAPVSFDMDSTAGISETEPNDGPGSATPVAGDVRQVFGQTEVDAPIVGSLPVPRSDFYKLTLPARTSLRVDMRTNGYQFISMSLLDAAGQDLASPTELRPVNTFTYTSGDSPQEVTIRVTPAAVQLPDLRSKYLLLLSYP